MKSLGTLCAIWLFLLFAVQAEGAQYFIRYAEQIDGAQSYAWIDPVIDGNGELSGFIFSDASSRKVVVQTESLQREIQLTTAPAMTAYKWVSEDTLLVYVLFGTDWRRELGLATVTLDTTLWHSIVPPIPYDPQASNATPGCRIRLITDGHTQYQGLLLETYVQRDWWDATQGNSSWTDAFSVIFRADLDSVLLKTQVYGMAFGMITGSDTADFAAFNNVKSSWNYSDWDDPYNYGSSSGTAALVQNVSEGTPLAQWSAQSCGSSAIFVGDFRSNMPHDEVIYVGCPTVAGVTDPGNGNVAACYSFASGSRTILWYNYEDRWDELTFPYMDGGAIAGTRGNNVAVFMNVRNGQITDSAIFDRDISTFHYFETGTSPKQLNLVGRSNDTVIVYQFDQVTDVDEPTSHPLPSTITLAQNYPNPFNPSTTIEFDLTRRTTVQLVVYNTLGQRVRTLLDESLPAGHYVRVWDGRTDGGRAAASGVYYYRISGDSFSTSRKMLLVK